MWAAMSSSSTPKTTTCIPEKGLTDIRFQSFVGPNGKIPKERFKDKGVGFTTLLANGTFSVRNC